jgi:hypothetical protein
VLSVRARQESASQCAIAKTHQDQTDAQVMTNLTEEQRRTMHRPITIDQLNAEARRLHAEGLRARDIAQILGLNDAAVISLLNN